MIDRTPPRHLFQGELEGRERLRRLARVMWPTTLAFLKTFPLAPDARCLDVGCGGGDVTAALSRMVPQGHVTGSGSGPVLRSAQARGHACRGGHRFRRSCLLSALTGVRQICRAVVPVRAGARMRSLHRVPSSRPGTVGRLFGCQCRHCSAFRDLRGREAHCRHHFRCDRGRGSHQRA